VRDFALTRLDAPAIAAEARDAAQRLIQRAGL